jgi:hypothetical protein
VSFGFDGRATRAEAWARQHVGGLVTNIVNEQLDTLRTVIGDQLAAGIAPRKIAVQIAGPVVNGQRQGGFIGLSRPQVGYLANARAELSALDAGYFSRTLRDRRFDPLVRKAIADGKGLAQADIDRIASRYSDRMLKHRADTIARTESITALRAGRREGIEQGIEAGAIAEQSLKRVWNATGDARTREDHAAMNGAEVDGLETPFEMPDGSMMLFPGDTSLGADAAQTINCRCYDEYVVDWLKEGQADTGGIVMPPVAPNPTTQPTETGQQPTTQEGIAAASAARLRELGAQTGHEHFEIIGADGRVLAASSSGHARKIEITPEQQALMSQRGADLSFHHNHPAPVASFSPADIDAFSKAAGLSSIYAHAEQASFQATRTAKTSQITSRVLQSAQKDAQTLMAKALNSGADVNTLLKLEPHAMMLVLEKRKYLKYNSEMPESVSRVARILNDNI